MAAGFKYNTKPIEDVMPEMCRFETVYRYSGGFNLDLDNLKGIDAIPPLTPLVLDFAKRTATAVINIEVSEKYTHGSNLELKIKKGSLAYTGMHIGNGVHGADVKGIDKSAEGYDKLTLSADFGADLEAGDVLFEAAESSGVTKKASATALNYAWTKVEDGATVTAIGRAFEIRPSRLIAPISEADKESLGDRFMFTL